MRNRAAERAAAEFARAASFGYIHPPPPPPPHAYTSFPTWPMQGAAHSPPPHLWSMGAAVSLHGLPSAAATSATMHNARMALPALSPRDSEEREDSVSPEAHRMIGKPTICVIKTNQR